MRYLPLVLLTAVVLILATGAFLLTRAGGGDSLDASVSVAEAMGGDTTGYARALGPQPFSFPEDYGAHPGFKTEWWYFTGNLDGPEGEPFGFQLTIFRSALQPPTARDAVRTSDWATDQLYFAHFAVTDVVGKTFYHTERFSRGSAGLAGAQVEPRVRIWLQDWEILGQPGELFPARLRARGDGFALDLTVAPLKPMILQGEDGYSQKGAERGNASYYYSFTRLAAEGTVTTERGQAPVDGLAWLDREWSTSALSDDQQGWDWFSLQLADGRDLMYYQIRRKDGGPSPYTEGTLVGPDGVRRELDLDEVALEPLDYWASPEGGRYPIAWRMRIPSEDLDLTIRAQLPDQELDTSVRYWEGAVTVEGSASGRGYLEMTGYGDTPGSPAS